MHDVKYITSTGATIDLDSPETAVVGRGGQLREHSWSYELESGSVRGVSARPREAEFPLIAPLNIADEVISLLSIDAELEAPGTLIADGWSQQAIVVSSQVVSAGATTVTLTLTSVLLDGFWWRERSRYLFRYVSEGGLNYAHDFPYDLGLESGRTTVTNAGALQAPLMVTFYGPCSDPHVSIAGNRYEVDCEVPYGSRLEVDGRRAVKSVTLRDSWGGSESVFPAAVRDVGAQAFEPLPAGTSVVEWPGEYDVRLDWRERRAVPPWAR